MVGPTPGAGRKAFDCAAYFSTVRAENNVIGHSWSEPAAVSMLSSSHDSSSEPTTVLDFSEIPTSGSSAGVPPELMTGKSQTFAT
jgi:hypothetical protein